MSSASLVNNQEQEIVALEQQWNSAIQHQDAAQMPRFLADSYFLAIGAQGQPLQITAKQKWLETLPSYHIESFSFDDMQVHIYGSTAIVLMLYTQKATVRGQDRSGQLVITDIWVKQSEGWRITERHSSRPEPPLAMRP